MLKYFLIITVWAAGTFQLGSVANAATCAEVEVTFTKESVATEQRDQMVELVKQATSLAGKLHMPAKFTIELKESGSLMHDGFAGPCYMRVACSYDFGRPVTPEQGARYSRAVAAHELGHVMLTANLRRDLPELEKFWQEYEILASIAARALGTPEALAMHKASFAVDKAIRDKVDEAQLQKLRNEYGQVSEDFAEKTPEFTAASERFSMLRQSIFGGADFFRHHELFADTVAVLIDGGLDTLREATGEVNRSFSEPAPLTSWHDTSTYGFYTPVRAFLKESLETAKTEGDKQRILSAL